MTVSPSVTTTVLVVPHTHWDREWYRPFEAYRARLVRTLDRLLADPLPYFLLDGQTIVLDDYLAMRPEAEETLRQRVVAGELGVGPWYVLVDEFLVSGEALVRNLLVGREGMARFGARDAVGYLPDMFGHIAQMPQVLKGFGLDTAVVWRGANPGAPRFIWRSPDGSEVATAWLPLGYYQTMFMEELTAETRAAQLATYLKAFEGEARVLLLSGADHMAPRLDMVAQLGLVNERLPGLTLELTPLHEALKGPRPKALLAGELRDPAKAYILPGVLSTRMHLKQANAACQTLLERYVEPICTLAWLGGQRFPTPFLAHAWRELLKNHPHDSICGCSIDQVHREMMPRFAAVQQVADELLNEALGVATRPVAGPSVALFNPTGWPYDGWLEVTVDWPLAGAPGAIALDGPDGREWPTVMLGVEDTEVFCAEIDFNPDWFPVRRFRLAVSARLAALAGASLRARGTKPAPARAPIAEAAAPTIENEHLALSVSGGRLELLDKDSMTRYEDCLAFLDEGDAGDEYNFSPLAGDIPVAARMTGARVVSREPHRATLELTHSLDIPVGLSVDRHHREGPSRTLAIVSKLVLESGQRRVSLEITLDNGATDHRLRLLTALGPGPCPQVWAEGPFGVFRRELAVPTPLPVAKGVEAIMPEFPQGLFSTLERLDRGLAVANQGLPEASILETAAGWSLATTLVRSVGWLSRDDLRTRGGGAGPRFETPEAQCQGAHTFHLALAPYQGSWHAVLPTLHQWAAPPIARVAEGLALGGVDLGDPRVVLSALKREQDGRAAVLRVYNPTPEPIDASLAVHWPHAAILASDLAEAAHEQLGSCRVPYRLRPYEIKTWLVMPPTPLA